MKKLSKTKQYIRLFTLLGGVFIFAALVFTACDPPREQQPRKTYNFEFNHGKIEITIDHWTNIRKEAREVLNLKQDQVADGYYLYDFDNDRTQKIFVPYSNKKDKDGNYLPDFHVLGHELWHCVEFGGPDYHK